MKTWDDLTGAGTASVVAWAGDQAWARAMAACGQDAGWHAEGDVWTHTLMVCAELERLPEWPALNRIEQLKLLLTGLFHDAGKPATTTIDPETGRTRSPRHAQVGAEIARRELRALGCDLVTREEIVSLVRYHGRPTFLLEKEKPELEVIDLSWRVSNRHLYLFALADTRGRTTSESGRPEDNLHLWKLAAEESNCFDRPYAFANDQARFLFYRQSLSSLHYIPREDYRCTVTLMSGLPGAGKDTWLVKERPALPVVSLDQLRGELEIDATENQGEVIQAARERCREHLRAGRDFALNATNTMRQTRTRWIDLFADYSARIEIVYVEPPLSQIHEQNSRRSDPVPKKVIDRLADRLETPAVIEAHATRLVDA